jgi:hypothetical protein
MSIQGRLVGPREQVLNVPITCWWHGPCKTSSSSSTEAWLKLTALLVGLREKLGTDPQIGRPACWGLCQEPLFSGAVRSFQIYRWLVKGCYALTTWDMYSLGPYANWAWDACGVLVRFSPAGCISIRTTATLSNHHVANLMSLVVLLLCCLIHLIICNSYMIRVECTFLWNVLNRAKIWK